MRLVVEILTQMRRRVGPDYIVGVRKVCDEEWYKGLACDEGVEIVRRLSDRGLIDVVNVIRGQVGTDEGLSRVIPTWARARRPTSILAARSAAKRAVRRSMRRASRTSPPRGMPLPAASST